jgi:hypothetical protein
MMTDKQRIKLAEFVGWKREPMRENLKRPYWQCPDTGDWSRAEDIPDPRNDANDCEALVVALGNKGIGVDIYMRPWMDAESVTVYMQGEPIEWKERRWTGDDWKHGVCDLAEKVNDG